MKKYSQMKKMVLLYLLCTAYCALSGFHNLYSIYWLGITQISLAIIFAVISQYILIKENRIETTNEEDDG